MSDFIDRLVNEISDLGTKASKLALFIESEQYNSLDQENKFLLKQQLGLMNLYENILRKRLVLLSKEQ